MREKFISRNENTKFIKEYQPSMRTNRGWEKEGEHDKYGKQAKDYLGIEYSAELEKYLEANPHATLVEVGSGDANTLVELDYSA